MHPKAILFFFLLIPVLGHSQIGGKFAYQFLNLVSSPRQAALGGKNLTNFDYDVTQPLLNPAAINIEMDNQLALNYVNYLGDVAYGSAAYAYAIDGREKVFHVGVTYVDYGNFEGFDEFGNPTGEFTGNEIAFSVGYAFNIPWTDFYLGANAKLISSSLEQYNSFGGAVDVGVFYKNEALRFNAALVARNLGTQFSTYAGVNEPLPLAIDLGLSQELEHVPIRWHVTLENLQYWNSAFSNPNRAEQSLDGTETQESVNFAKELIRHTILGAELFPRSGFNIRVGYNFRRGEELKIVDQRNFSGLSAGFAIKMNKLRFQYTYARYSVASNSSFFGVMLNLN